MTTNIKNVAVIGTGVIGAGWIIRCLAHNKKVVAYDKDLKLKKILVAEIKRTWPYVKKLFNKKKLNLKNFTYVTSIEEALKKAEFIQECATESYRIKTKLMSISANTQNQTLLFHQAHQVYFQQEYIQSAKIQHVQ